MFLTMLWSHRIGIRCFPIQKITQHTGKVLIGLANRKVLVPSTTIVVSTHNIVILKLFCLDELGSIWSKFVLESCKTTIPFHTYVLGFCKYKPPPFIFFCGRVVLPDLSPVDVAL